MKKNGLLAAAVALLALPALGGALMPRPAVDAGAAVDQAEVVGAALAWQGGYEPMAALAAADAEAILKPPADPSTIARGDRHRHECGRCVRGLGDHLVGHALERVAEFCRHSECPVVREHCKHLKEHEDVLVGFLVARIRPFELSAFFCTGRGACGHEHGDSHALNATSAADLDAAGPALALASLLRLAGGSEEVRELVGGNWAGPVDLFGRDDDGVDEDGGDGDSDGPERRCSACVHRVARHVMHGVVGGIVEMCHHTECPVIRAHCEWMHRHEGFVFGTLLERVEPAKFGVGACIANGSCEHGGGGGGGGGGGDGDSDGGDGDSDGGEHHRHHHGRHHHGRHHHHHHHHGHHGHHDE